MKTYTKSILQVAGIGALAVVMATPAFAAPQRQTGRQDPASDSRTESHDRNGNWNRDNQRRSVTGQITSVSHERGSYRVQLDRGRESYWIPESRLNNRGRDLRTGLSITLGGLFRGGRIEVDAVTWSNDRGDRNNHDDFVRGTVERVDVRHGFAYLRDASSRRTIEVEMRESHRSRGLDLGDLRRGDSVTFSGQWLRKGRFAADEIESVKTRR